MPEMELVIVPKLRLGTMTAGGATRYIPFRQGTGHQQQQQDHHQQAEHRDRHGIEHRPADRCDHLLLGLTDNQSER